MPTNTKNAPGGGVTAPSPTEGARPTPNALKEIVMPNHTPHDSLQFLHASASLLDWVCEEITGFNSDEPDVDLAVDAIASFQALIRHEINLHGWTGTYTTGHPVTVDRRHRQIEPDADGGPDQIVWTTYRHTCTPDGKVMGANDESA